MPDSIGFGHILIILLIGFTPLSPIQHKIDKDQQYNHTIHYESKKDTSKGDIVDI